MSGVKNHDGAVAEDGDGTAFSSAQGDFVSEGVTAGHILTIENGALAGDYEILTVDSETQVTIDGTFSGSGSSLRYRIGDADGQSMVHTYQSLSEAIAFQVAHYWRMRGKGGVANESVGGLSVSFEAPFTWLEHVRAVLENYKAVER